MFLYIIRHGEPDYKTDTLTGLGLKQAEALSQRFIPVKFDRIFSSPLGRARQTALPTCEKQQKDMEVKQWLSENLAYDAMAIDINGNKDWWFSVQNTNFLDSNDAKKYYNEKAQAFYNSTVISFDAFLSELGYKKCDSGYSVINPNDEKHAVFCHGGISRIILSHALSIPFHVFCASFDIPFTGVTVLHFENTKDGVTAPRCLMLSDLTHLYSLGIDKIYNNAFDI